jgi:hypothetical protein
MESGRHWRGGGGSGSLTSSALSMATPDNEYQKALRVLND